MCYSVRALLDCAGGTPSSAQHKSNDHNSGRADNHVRHRHAANHDGQRVTERQKAMEVKYYRTSVFVDVLSTESLGDDISIGLDELHRLITDGPMSGKIVKGASEEVTEQHMIHLCGWQGTDPEFFGIEVE